MEISSELMDLACQTEGNSYDTKLRIQGLEVWGIPPHQYRHYTEFFLQYPTSFPSEVQEVDGKYWDVGYVAGDGKFRSRYGSYKSREEALSVINVFEIKEFYANCPINVFYTKTGEPDGSFSDEDLGVACGVVLVDRGCDWEVFNISVTPEEAELILGFEKLVQAEWESRATDWRKHQESRLQAVAEATASEGLRFASSGLLECLECGATYDEPGHVEYGGMSCDLCG